MSTFPVYPRVGGGQQRVWYMCRALSERFDVEIISLTASAEARRRIHLLHGVDELVVPKSLAHESEEARRGAGMPFPISDILTAELIEQSPEYLSAVREALDGAVGAILEHPYMYPALAAAEFGGAVFYDANNAEVSLKAESLSDTIEGKRLVGVVRAVEGAAIAASSLVFYITQEDRGVFETEFLTAADRFIKAPNGIDTDTTPFVDGVARRRWRERWLSAFGALAGPERLRHTALFVASLHGPNIDAARRILELAPSLDDVLFILAGSVCDYYQRLPVPPNVVLLGLISEPRRKALLSAADVGLNPMLQGSGSNIKMLDYLAAGLPVVTTAHGARGLDLGSDCSSVRVAAPEDFATAIRGVLDDPATASAGAAVGRRLVEQGYDWSVIGRRVLDAVSRTLDSLPDPV